MSNSGTIPFDLAAIEGWPGWEQSFVWPAPHVELKAITRDIATRYMEAIWKLRDEDSRRLAFLATRCLSDMLLVVETAILMERGRLLGVRFVGGPPLVAALSGQRSTNDRYTPRAQLVYHPIRHQFLRRVARVASWTPINRMPKAVIAPDAVAYSHNTLLRSEAMISGRAIGFVHAEKIVSRARENAETGSSLDISTVLSELFRVVAETPTMPPGMIDRACQILKERLEPYLNDLAIDLSALRRVDLPAEVWCGSAGHRPVRGLALEAARRGGKVIVHDHAGAAGLFVDGDSLLLAEFNVASKFVASTAATAHLVRSSGAIDRISAFKSIELAAGSGDPFFAVSPRAVVRNSMSPRKALYVVGAFDGQARRSPPSLNDPLKLDWWRRIAACLAKLPIDLRIQAHPGGVLRGKPNPLSAIAPLSGQRFEVALKWAELLVIDVTQSTTLTYAICTDLPIVLIDYGRNEFNPTILPMIQDRCCIVKCTFDERNRVVIDPEELATAIMCSPPSSDGSSFRTLFAGRHARL